MAVKMGQLATTRWGNACSPDKTTESSKRDFGSRWRNGHVLSFAMTGVNGLGTSAEESFIPILVSTSSSAVQYDWKLTGSLQLLEKKGSHREHNIAL